MSDTVQETQTSTPVTESAAPVESGQVETPATEAPQTAAPEQAQQPEQRGPLSKREARAALLESHRARRESRLSQAHERVTQDTDEEQQSASEGGPRRDPATGRFLPAEAATEPTHEASTTEASSTGTEAEPEAVPESQGPPKTVRIEIPDGDLRRLVGNLDHIDVAPEMEQFVRWSLNNVVRRNRVEELEQQLRQEREERIRLESRFAATSKFEQTPEYQQYAEMYHRIRESEGEDAAKVFWKGIQTDLQRLQDEEYQTRIGEITREESQRRAQTWAGEAYQRAQTSLPQEIRTLPHFGQLFQEALQLFDRAVELGHYQYLANDPDRANKLHAAFQKELGARLRRDPEVARIVDSIREHQSRAAAARAAEEARRRQAEQKASTDAVESFKRDAANRRTAQPPNPLATVNEQAAGTRALAIEEEQPDTSNMSSARLRQHSKRKALEIARSRLGR